MADVQSRAATAGRVAIPAPSCQRETGVQSIHARRPSMSRVRRWRPSSLRGPQPKHSENSSRLVSTKASNRARSALLIVAAPARSATISSGTTGSAAVVAAQPDSTVEPTSPISKVRRWRSSSSSTR